MLNLYCVLMRGLLGFDFKTKKIEEARFCRAYLHVLVIVTFNILFVSCRFIVPYLS